MRGLGRDQIGFELYELVDAERLLPFYAAHYGYASADDARVARRFSPMPDGKQAAALRAAFAATMKDPEFLAEAKALNFDVDPVLGEKMQQIVENVLATPKPVAARAKALLE